MITQVPNFKGETMKEIRIHGRGGQGSVTAAELLATSFFEDGKVSQAFPMFGSERMGAPVQAFVRVDSKPIRTREQVHHPDYIIVQDPTLIGTVNVLDGIKAAKEAGLDPVKVNMVVIRGINDDEVLDFARLTIEQEWHVRFIEPMPFGIGEDISFVPTGEIQERLLSLGSLEPCLPSQGNGPAKYFRFEGTQGTVGFISPLSEHFCFNCNRLRLTVDGKLRPCLLSDEEVDLKNPLRRGASPDELKGLIQQAVAQKPERHHLSEGVLPKGRAMCQVGG